MHWAAAMCGWLMAYWFTSTENCPKYSYHISYKTRIKKQKIEKKKKNPTRIWWTFWREQWISGLLPLWLGSALGTSALRVRLGDRGRRKERRRSGASEGASQGQGVISWSSYIKALVSQKSIIHKCWIAEWRLLPPHYTFTTGREWDAHSLSADTPHAVLLSH